VIRIVTAKAWKQLNQELLQAKGLLVGEQEKSKFLESKGLEAIAKVKELSDMLAKCATWLGANIMASGRSHRILTSHEVSKAAGFDLGAEPAKDGGVQIRIIPKGARGEPLKPGQIAMVGTTPDANPKPKTLDPEPAEAPEVQAPAG
jgi:hypothetical protein